MQKVRMKHDKNCFSSSDFLLHPQVEDLCPLRAYYVHHSSQVINRWRCRHPSSESSHWCSPGRLCGRRASQRSWQHSSSLMTAVWVSVSTHSGDMLTAECRQNVAAAATTLSHHHHRCIFLHVHHVITDRWLFKANNSYLYWLHYLANNLDLIQHLRR